jgi:hypothetical protein
MRDNQRTLNGQDELKPKGGDQIIGTNNTQPLKAAISTVHNSALSYTQFFTQYSRISGARVW